VSRRYRLARLPAIALAIGIPIGGVMLILLADVPIRRDLGLLTAVAVVIVLAWAGGIWPGLISTLLLVVLFAGPLGLDQFTPPLDDLSLWLFAVAGLVGTGVVESLYRARWRVESARDRARDSRRSEAAVRAELESVVAAIGDGIMVADADGSISLMNQAAVDLLGRRIARFDQLLDEFAPSETSTVELDGDAPVTAEFQLVADNRRMELSSFPLASEDEPIRHVLVLRDVTVTRRRELLRDAFLSLLSHELRTPMTAVYGGVTLLQRVGDKLDAATRNELRADIVFEADRLARLIEDLLVLARIDAGVELGQEPALLQHIVLQVINRDHPGELGKTIRVAADPGLPPVRGDETSIQQVVHNLISNAIKYSPDGSGVDVQVAAGDDEVLVRVLDRGRGLPADDAAHVFEPFYRGSATERMVGGIGIGLFVCQRLVEAMGGRLWTTPREGGGSEFGFALPWWPIEADEADELGSIVGTGSSA
jgi:signal transduction histidine kinase